jgi:hypothetical protein
MPLSKQHVKYVYQMAKRRTAARKTYHDTKLLLLELATCTKNNAPTNISKISEKKAGSFGGLAARDRLSAVNNEVDIQTQTDNAVAAAAATNVFEELERDGARQNNRDQEKVLAGVLASVVGGAAAAGGVKTLIQFPFLKRYLVQHLGAVLCGICTPLTMLGNDVHTLYMESQKQYQKDIKRAIAEEKNDKPKDYQDKIQGSRKNVLRQLGGVLSILEGKPSKSANNSSMKLLIEALITANYITTSREKAEARKSPVIYMQFVFRTLRYTQKTLGTLISDEKLKDASPYILRGLIRKLNLQEIGARLAKSYSLRRGEQQEKEQIMTRDLEDSLVISNFRNEMVMGIDPIRNKTEEILQKQVEELLKWKNDKEKQGSELPTMSFSITNNTDEEKFDSRERSSKYDTFFEPYDDVDSFENSSGPFDADQIMGI